MLAYSQYRMNALTAEGVNALARSLDSRVNALEDKYLRRWLAPVTPTPTLGMANTIILETATGNALQDAINALDDGGAVIIPPGMEILIEEPIIIAGSMIKICCLAPLSQHTPKLKAAAPDMDLFRVTGWGPAFSNVALWCSDDDQAVVNEAHGTVVGIRLDRSGGTNAETYSNLDASIQNCVFYNLAEAIRFVGRNVFVIKNIFSGCRYAVAGFVHSYTSGGTTYYSSTRGIGIHGNRFHVGGGPWVYGNDLVTDTVQIALPTSNPITSYGMEALKAISVRDNEVDFSGPFYRGTLTDVEINNNLVYMACGPFVTCDASALAPSGLNVNGSSSISNNIWGGHGGATGGYYTPPAHFIDVENCANVQIGGNSISRTAKYAIAVQNCPGANIVGNRIHKANVNYADQDIGDHPAIRVGSDTGYSYGDSLYNWIDANQISGGTYDYGIYSNGRSIFVRCGLNHIEKGRSGYVGSSEVGDNGVPAHMYYDTYSGGGALNVGDLVIHPYSYFGKASGRVTRIIGNLHSTGDLRQEGSAGIGLTAPTARCHVKGAGATSSTTGLLVQDSASTATFTVRDDGAYAFKGGSVGLAPTGYTTFANLSTDRTCDANATTLEELADILGTLIEDLKTKGIISA